MSHKNKKIDVFLITVSLIAVLLTVIGLAAFPAQAESAANQLFELSTRTFGTSVQVLVFGSTLAVLYLAFSKYGNIRLAAASLNTQPPPGCSCSSAPAWARRPCTGA